MSVFRLAIISDVHADVHALTDALTRIDRLACHQIVWDRIGKALRRIAGAGPGAAGP